MKRIVTFFLCGIFLFLISGCGKIFLPDSDDSSPTLAEQSISGEAFYSPGWSYIQVTDEKNSSSALKFVITEETELIWTEEALTSLCKDSDSVGWEILSVYSTKVCVTYQEKAESPRGESEIDKEGWYNAKDVTVLEVEERNYYYEKPVIYLYPEVETEVSVLLDYRGTLTCTYPSYGDGWRVTAKPDGTLTDAAGQIYNYLYWEGIGTVSYDFSEGFCVAGKDTAAFLEDALARLGLTRREANEFIVYWLPQMEQNPYNLISFQQEAYTESAPLTVTPAPDTLIRVFMAYQPLEMPVEIEPQSLSAPVRTGFTVVEWGGAVIK